MMIALERLCEYKKDPNHYMEEHIGVMYNKHRNFKMIFSEHYELSVEQQMGIVLDSLPDSWEYERKALLEEASDVKYNEIIPKLKEQLERQIQSGIRQSGKSMNAFPWVKKMSGTLTEKEFARKEHEGHQRNE